jgi:hypothetical protein
MGVQDVGAQSAGAVCRHGRRHAGQGGETQRVIRPVAAIGRGIGIARPVKQMRRVQHGQVQPCGTAAQQPDGAAKEIAIT